MSEDPLLRELGHLAKEEKEAEQARFDERWDRLAAGTLTVEEEAELRALAAAAPEAREAYEAFRPLGAEFQARMADALAAEVKKPSRLLSFRRPATLRFARWSTAAAAASAGLLFLLRTLVSAPALPVYTAELSGGVQALRGEASPAGGPHVFAAGDRFQVVLVPLTKTVGKDLEARCFLLRGRELRRLEVQSQLDPDGAVKMEGSIGESLLPGTWTLWAVVGRRGKLPNPTAPGFLAARAAIRRRDWVAVPAVVQIHPRGP